MKTRARSLATTAFIVAVAFYAGSATRAQEGGDKAAKEKKVRQLLEVNGTGDLARSQFDDMCKQFSENPNIPKGFEKKFRELAKPQDLVEIVVPVYMKHLDDDVLDSLIAFYGTDAGKKFAKAQPALAADSQTAGIKWGSSMAMKVIGALQGGGDDKKHGDDDDDDAPAPKKKDSGKKTPTPGGE